MFSNRLPPDLEPNRLSRVLEPARRDGRAIDDLTASNPTRAGFAYPPDLLAPLAGPGVATYDPAPLGSFAARSAIAADYARRGLTVSPDRIVLTSSTSEAYSVLFKLLANPGDEVLVPRPSYPLFDCLARLDAVATRQYNLEYHGRWSVDVPSVEQAFTARTKALCLVSPNNPTGSFIKQGELDRLASLCASRHAAIIVDEVFVGYELEAAGADGAGRVLDRRDVLAFALGGLSKSVGLPQVKLGWVAVAGPDDCVRAALQRLEHICDTYLSVSTPVQAAASELLTRGALVRAQIHARVLSNYRLLKELVAEVPACEVLRAEAGWCAVIRVPSIQSEEDLVVDLLECENLLTYPGYFFDFSNGSHLVLSLLMPSPAFASAVRRMMRHLDCTELRRD
jgi:aspartate/methionine/tyrosine aminotransferase